jgi:hypothetical protein
MAEQPAACRIRGCDVVGEYSPLMLRFPHVQNKRKPVIGQRLGAMHAFTIGSVDYQETSTGHSEAPLIALVGSTGCRALWRCYAVDHPEKAQSAAADRSFVGLSGNRWP